MGWKAFRHFMVDGRRLQADYTFWRLSGKLGPFQIEALDPPWKRVTTNCELIDQLRAKHSPKGKWGNAGFSENRQGYRTTSLSED